MRSVVALLVAAAIGACPAPARSQAVPPAAPVPSITVPVLDHAIAKGDLLAADDFITQEVPLVEGRVLPRLKDLVGMEAARALLPGTVLRQSDVIRPQLVRRGEPVTIALRDGGLSITTAGRALGNGAAGDFVRIVSLSTNRTLEGVVESTGIVRIAPH